MAWIRTIPVATLALTFLMAAGCSSGSQHDTRAAFCTDVATLQDQLNHLAAGSPADVELADATLSSLQADFDRQATAFMDEQPELVSMATQLSQAIGRLRDAAKSRGDVAVASEELATRIQRANSACV